MSKHTPGPWVAAEMYSSIPSLPLLIEAASRSEKHMASKVAEVEYDEDKKGYYVDNKEEALANARLIASAPELLEALQRTVDALETVIKDAGGCDHSVGICMCDDIRIVADGRAAIAKATQ